MTDLSFTLAKALSTGRAQSGRPHSREEVLLRLLRKRAVAQREGLDGQEAALREQIRWALPMQKIEEE